MSISIVIILVVVLFIAGALLSVWAGIRSLQSARTVVFYRTRRARMLAGWQWLAAALALASFAVVLMLLGEPVVNQFFSPTPLPTTLSTATRISPPTSTQTDTPFASQTLTQSASETLTSTSTPSATAPSLTPTINATFATQTARRSTFIAALSATPTATRTPIPTWTRTPTSPPPPTWTPSLTPTPRPTFTPTSTPTP